MCDENVYPSIREQKKEEINGKFIVRREFANKWGQFECYVSASN